MGTTAYWIWKNYKASVNELLLFRKELTLSCPPENYTINISADSRYKLFINNRLLCCGPGKGSTFYKYFDEIDIAPFLKSGTNCIAVEVAHYSGDSHDCVNYDTGATSVISTCRGGLLIKDLTDTGLLNTDTTWSYYDCKEYKFIKSYLTSSADFNDEINGKAFPFGWKNPGFDDGGWKTAQAIQSGNLVLGRSILSPWYLKKREIPFSTLKKTAFQRVMRSSGNLSSTSDFLSGTSLKIPKNTQAFIELDVGEYLNAEIVYHITGGLGGKIDLTYGECYGVFDETGQFVKGIRDDCSGDRQLNGDTQTIYCGSGVQDYQPFAYKTFRFLRLEFYTKDEELSLDGIEVYETGYPWEFQGSFSCDNRDYNKIWDISIKTIERCTYETFMDCPYYERMQYIMDTMLQANYLYGLTDDHRLIRQSLLDFSNAQLPDGIIPCCAPSNFISVIPGFMLFYIFYLHDYYIFTGDISFVKQLLPTAEKVINYFLTHKLENNLIGDTGFWQYVDWTVDWADGSPVTKSEDINIIYNMMFVKALKDCACLFEALGRADTAAELRTLGEQTGTAVKSFAWDIKKQLFSATTDHSKNKSQHAQVWAVLSGISSGEEAKAIMKAAIEDNTLSKCSYSMSYFLFRALEETGLYSFTQKLLEQWIDLLKYNVTTWPEDNLSQRSDCHAWSAVPLYEFVSCYLGVKPLEPGYKKVLIKPLALWLRSYEGKVVTPKGILEISCECVDGKFNLKAQLPENLESVIELPDGSTRQFCQPMIEYTCKI